MIDQVRPIALLLTRVAVGTIFVVHGYQKFFVLGISGTTQFFESVGVPLAGLAAVLVAIVELVGGIALILGAALPIASPLLAIVMVGAAIFVHIPNGFDVAQGGYEFVLGLAGALLAIGFTGGGALAVDGLRKQGRTPAPASA